MHEQCTVTSPVRVGSRSRGKSRASASRSAMFARCDPGTTPSSPFSRVAPVTEIPTVRPQQCRLCPPREQSLCQLTSEMRSTTPTFLSNPSAVSPRSGTRPSTAASTSSPRLIPCRELRVAARYPRCWVGETSPTTGTACAADRRCRAVWFASVRPACAPWLNLRMLLTLAVGAAHLGLRRGSSGTDVAVATAVENTLQ